VAWRLLVLGVCTVVGGLNVTVETTNLDQIKVEFDRDVLSQEATH
jgi:hypothetical protein